MFHKRVPYVNVWAAGLDCKILLHWWCQSLVANTVTIMVFATILNLQLLKYLENGAASSCSELSVDLTVVGAVGVATPVIHVLH